MKHKRVVEEWYEISFNASHRTLGGKLDEFLKDAPDFEGDAEAADETWQDNHTVLRDFEGDFDGLHIYHSDKTEPLLRFICKEIGVAYSSVEGLSFKLVG